MKDQRVKRAEDKLRTRRGSHLPKQVFWEEEPTAEELERLKERGLEPIKVKFV